MQNTAIGKALSRSRNALTTKMLLVMRMTAFLLILFFQASAFTESAAQVTLKESSATLEKVLKTIQHQSAYDLVFDKALLQAKAKPVTVNVTNVPVKEALDKVFAQQELLTYGLSGKIISVMERKGNPAMMLTKTEIPVIDVRGKVTDENGKPVVGASVQVKGANKGTTTDENGFYVLSGVDEKATLVISAVNIETREVGVNGRNEINLVAKVKVSQLDDVAVTVNTGYQQLKPNEVTGSVVVIDNKLLNRRVSSDILSRLDGIAAGVLFNGQNSTIPIDNISIRGRSTINGNTYPLVVVDNFPYTGDINLINPNDIASVTILKDAAAASLWGAFSGNGVIVITTKKGTYNQTTRVNFNSNITIGKKPDIFYDKQFLNSPSFIEVERFLFARGYYNDDLNNVAGNYPVISPVVEILNRQRLGLISATDANTAITTLGYKDIRQQYSSYFYQPSVSQQYALNVSGGNKKSTYYLSGGYDKGRPYLQGNSNSRISLNATFTFNPIRNLDISTGMIYTNSTETSNGMSSISASGKYQIIYPYAQLADQSGIPLQVARHFSEGFPDIAGLSGLLDWNYVPLEDRFLTDNRSQTIDNRIVASAKYTLIKGLSLEGKFQHQKGTVYTRIYNDPASYFVRNMVNTYSQLSGNVVSFRPVPIGGILSNASSSNTSNAGRFQLNFDKVVDAHTLTFIGGADVREIKIEGYTNSIFGYDINTASSVPVDYVTVFPTIPDGSLRIPNSNNVASVKTTRFRSFFANASYTYAQKYTLTFSGRLDQANIFGVKTNHKGTPLWSAGFKWDTNKESFYKLHWLPILKTRITYGFNGNIDNTITAITTAMYNNGDAINNAPYGSISAPGNPQLRWEKMGMFNLGIDFGFKADIVTGSIDFFLKNGVDMIGRRTLPSSSGFLTTKGNYSNMKGSGVDLQLNIKLIDKQLKWNANIFFSHARDRIIRNEGDENKRVGKPVNAWYSYSWAGIDQQGDPLGYVNGSVSNDYTAILNAARSNPETMLYGGSTIPTFWGGARNTVAWKNLSLSMNITFKAGYFFKRNSIDYGTLFASGRGHEDYVLRWQKPGDELITTVPAMVYIDYPGFSARNSFYSGSSILIEKGDHVRLQDVNITYDLGSRILSKMQLRQVQLYFYTNNLGILWKSNKRGIDPDATSGFPMPKTYALGVRMGL